MNNWNVEKNDLTMLVMVSHDKCISAYSLSKVKSFNGNTQRVNWFHKLVKNDREMHSWHNRTLPYMEPKYFKDRPMATSALNVFALPNAKFVNYEQITDDTYFSSYYMIGDNIFIAKYLVSEEEIEDHKYSSMFWTKLDRSGKYLVIYFYDAYMDIPDITMKNGKKLNDLCRSHLDEYYTNDYLHARICSNNYDNPTSNYDLATKLHPDMVYYLEGEKNLYDRMTVSYTLINDGMKTKYNFDERENEQTLLGEYITEDKDDLRNYIKLYPIEGVSKAIFNGDLYGSMSEKYKLMSKYKLKLKYDPKLELYKFAAYVHRNNYTAIYADTNYGLKILVNLDSDSDSIKYNTVRFLRKFYDPVWDCTNGKSAIFK